MFVQQPRFLPLPPGNTGCTCIHRLLGFSFIFPISLFLLWRRVFLFSLVGNRCLEKRARSCVLQARSGFAAQKKKRKIPLSMSVITGITCHRCGLEQRKREREEETERNEAAFSLIPSFSGRGILFNAVFELEDEKLKGTTEYAENAPYIRHSSVQRNYSYVR